MSEERFKDNERVFVVNSRVHHYTGTVVGVLPKRIRVEFPRGGYGDGPYIADFYPRQLMKEGKS